MNCCQNTNYFTLVLIACLFGATASVALDIYFIITQHGCLLNDEILNLYVYLYGSFIYTGIDVIATFIYIVWYDNYALLDFLKILFAQQFTVIFGFVWTTLGIVLYLNQHKLTDCNENVKVYLIVQFVAKCALMIVGFVKFMELHKQLKQCMLPK